ncbi:MAG: hypothetical protein AAFX87_06825 [Bacteroidota bacterium]
MKNILKFIAPSLFLFGMVFVITSCGDDDVTGVLATEIPVTDAIAGATDVELGSTVTYSVPQRVGSTYAWTVTGATAAASTTGTVSVTFDVMGASATVTVVETNEAGRAGDAQTADVTISNTAPTATSSLAGLGIYKDGDTDSVKVSFDFPVSAPVVSSSGLGTDITDVAMTAIDAQNYFTIVAFDNTGADSDVEFVVSGAARTLGGMMQANDTASAEIDNTAPTASIAFSSAAVNDEGTVDFTITFDEDMGSMDTLLFVDITGAGIDAVEDTVVIGDDPNMLSYTFTPTGAGDGMVTIAVSGLTDLVGNEVNMVPLASNLMVDNTAPMITNEGAGDVGTAAELSVTSDSDGMAYFVVLADGADAPMDAAGVMSNSAAVASGSFETIGNLSRSTQVALATGAYDVYYVVKDVAGNVSGVSSAVDLTLD